MDNEQSPQQPKQSLYPKPGAVLIAQIFLAFCAFGALGAASEISRFLNTSGMSGASAPILGLIYISVGLFAIFLIIALNRRKHVRGLTIFYLIGAVLFFPIFFRYGVDAGVFTPPYLLPRDQLGGSALLEKARLILLPFVALLFALDKRTKLFLNSVNMPNLSVEDNTK